MRTSPLCFVLLAAAAAACTRPDRGAQSVASRPHYLADVPVIPRSIVTDTTGIPNAEHRGMSVQWPMDSVAAYYRRELVARGWRIMADVADTGQVSLYLQRDSVSLWVQVHNLGMASEYALTAAGLVGSGAKGAGTPGPGAPR